MFTYWLQKMIAISLIFFVLIKILCLRKVEKVYNASKSSFEDE